MARKKHSGWARRFSRAERARQLRAAAKGGRSKKRRGNRWRKVQPVWPTELSP